MLSRSSRGTVIAEAFPNTATDIFFSCRISSGFTGVIARFSGCNWDVLPGLFQEIFDHSDHLLLFRKQGEVAGVRDHGELGVGDELEGRNGVFQADKIVISQDDKNRRFDGSQLFVRKPSPLNAADLAPELGPVV